MANFVSVASQFGSSQYIRGLTVKTGIIYGVTDDGYLVRWNGSNAWVQCATVNGVSFHSVYNFNNKIYVGAGPVADGNPILFEYDDVSTLTPVGNALNNIRYLYDMNEYENELYFATANGDHLYKWNGSDALLYVDGTSLIGSSRSLLKIDSDLYLDRMGRLAKWNPDDGMSVLIPTGSFGYGSVWSLTERDGQIFGGTNGYTFGRLLLYDGIDAWSQIAPTYDVNYVCYKTYTFANKIICGMGEYGVLQAWNDIDAWEILANKLNDETYILSFCKLNGSLYAGTYPNANLFRLDGLTEEVVDSSSSLSSSSSSEIEAELERLPFLRYGSSQLILDGVTYPAQQSENIEVNVL